MPSKDSPLRHRSVLTNGVELFVTEAGPEDGPLVVLLHGFPEFWYGWHHQIGPLAEAGYRVLVPDQRGYHVSDKPRKIREYRVRTLARDIVGLLDEADRERAAIIGHDWGGIVAWWLGAMQPDRVSRLGIVNAPHPGVMRRVLRSSAAQRRRSRYILWFQAPVLPERLLSRNQFAPLWEAMVDSARPGAFSDRDLERYRAAWSSPGALTAMLNWYRALRFQLRAAAGERVTAPTLLVWGLEDRFLGPELVEPSAAMCLDSRVVKIEDAGHWVLHEQPDAVSAALLEHLRPLLPEASA